MRQIRGTKFVKRANSESKLRPETARDWKGLEWFRYCTQARSRSPSIGHLVAPI